MATPTYATVIEQINDYIVANGNNEITANVLNPILQLITVFTNNNIGDLDNLTTEESNSIVEAVNSLKQNFDDLVNNGVQLHTGIDNPNTTLPVTYNYADFYMQLDVDSLPVKLWQWNGFEWVDTSEEGIFSLKSNFINIKDLGGIGDGVFDNTTIINTALSTYKEVYFPDGNYLVTSLINYFGSKITGSGIIVKSITGGKQQLNTGIDRYNYFFGQEYLSFVQSKQLADLSYLSVPIKVSFTGDSTTFGDSTTAPFKLNNLFLSLAKQKGISNITALNNGHSGIDTEMWRTTYLTSELAENPDLYIIRYGINDPYYLKSGGVPPVDAGDDYLNRRDIGDFETSLRSALTTIRASKGQDQLSIILMSPNCTSDTPNGRDEKWYEQVRKVYIQASRDFQCAFIDTYGLWLDSRNGAANLFMDDPYGDGRAIHPKDIFNTWIVSEIFELVYPDALLNKISDSHIYNRSGVDELPLFSDTPSTYKRGLTINRVDDSDGWGVDGSAFTIFNRDLTGGQFNFSRLTATPELRYRSINFGPGEGVSLGFSNSVRMWHSGNLPIQVNGNSIYSTAPYDTDVPNTLFTKIPDNSTYTCYGVDTDTGFTGTPLIVTSRFSSSYGNQTAHFVSGSGTGKKLVRSMDAGAWSSWQVLTGNSSGVYTPTFTAIANITSTTLVHAYYQRMAGDVVSVSMCVSVQPTANITATSFYVTLPFSIVSSFPASANIGQGVAIASGYGITIATVKYYDSTKVVVEFPSVNNVMNFFNFNFMYKL